MKIRDGKFYCTCLSSLQPLHHLPKPALANLFDLLVH